MRNLLEACKRRERFYILNEKRRDIICSDGTRERVTDRRIVEARIINKKKLAVYPNRLHFYKTA